MQGNLCILPADYANEFLQFCQANPKPCPLIGMASNPGDFHSRNWAKTSIFVPTYPATASSKMANWSTRWHDISDIWREDLVSFVLGCSFSFEEALIDDGLEIRNVSEGVNVPMYRTDIDCNTAGRFASKMVVSMRPMIPSDAIRAIQICTRFPRCPWCTGSFRRSGEDRYYAILINPNSATRSPYVPMKCLYSGPAG